jgi:hypothetical protein
MDTFTPKPPPPQSLDKWGPSSHSDLVRDIIIGMSDGPTVPFALTAGLRGVLNTTHLIIVSGLSEIAYYLAAMAVVGTLLNTWAVLNYRKTSS